MSLLSLDHFSLYPFEKKGRFLGCDLGEKTIGLALSDINRKIASPFQVIHRTQWKKDVEILLKIIAEHRIVGIVVGFPLNMNGTEGPRCQSTRQFVVNLLTVIDLPFCLWDERLSTAAVTRTLVEADLSRAKRKKVVDKVAASYILQGFLDAFGRLQKLEPSLL
jgi:putative Holliday junction resolvase